CDLTAGQTCPDDGDPLHATRRAPSGGHGCLRRFGTAPLGGAAAAVALRRRRLLDAARVAALFAAGADELRVLLAAAVHQKGMFAERAGLRHRLLPDLEVTLGVVRAAVEGFAALLLRSDFDDVALALGAGNAERHRLGVLALRVAAAGQEGPVASRLDHHRALALVALVVGELRLGRRSFGRQILGVFAPRVGFTTQKPAVFAPTLEHGGAALRARELRALRLGRPALLFLGGVEHLPEALIEALEQLHPIETARLHLVQIFF